MAKAVVPFAAFRKKFTLDDTEQIVARLQEFAQQFLHEGPPAEKKREPAGKT